MGSLRNVLRKGRLGLLVASVALGAVAAIALSAELEVAELDGTVNTVTVEQGSSANFTISLSASGSVACGSTHTATVHTSYSVDSAGAVSSSAMSAAKTFTAPTVCSGTNGTVTWDGAPTKQTVSASVSASATAPLGPHTVELKEANGNTATTDSNSSGGKLDDTAATTLTINVVAPAGPTNAAPSVPGAPALDGSSSTPNQGVFGLTWSGSTDDGLPSGSSISYQLQHKDADDAGYSDVSGATALSTNSFSFTSGSPEAEGTWTYQVRASDGTLQSAYSGPSSAVKVDKSAPSAPTASTTPASPAFGDWFKDSVTVSYGGSTDPNLADGSAGSGVASYTADEVFTTSGTHNYSGKATDNVGLESTATTGSVKVDATEPTVSITGCPSAPVLLGSTGSVAISAGDEHSGLGTDPSDSDVPLDTSTIGSKTISATAIDNVGHEKSASCNYSVIWDFDGFFQPVDNLPTFNKAKAGSAIPVKFSLNGDQGLAIFDLGGAGTTDDYPRSQTITCGTNPDNIDGIEQTVTAGQSALQYDALLDQYTYVWKTDKSWGVSCRQLVVKLIDGTYHRANFNFTK